LCSIYQPSHDLACASFVLLVGIEEQWVECHLE
jgi:hypothetical protein